MTPTEMQSHVTALLQGLGEDPSRDGLLDTPRRVVSSLRELTSGYHVDVAALLATTFDVNGHDALVVVRDVPFYSLCEHHLLPFHGTVTVGYLPRDRVVGLSKIARLVDAFARRLQVQERMTDQIAHALDVHLSPMGVGVVIEGLHLCMAMRGVQRAATMVTSAMLGELRHNSTLRAEFLHGASAS